LKKKKTTRREKEKTPLGGRGISKKKGGAGKLKGTPPAPPPPPKQRHCQGQSRFKDTTFVTDVIKEVIATRSLVSRQDENKRGSKNL